MKKAMSAKSRRRLFLGTGMIWLANAGLNGWWMVTRWEWLVNTGQATMRGLNFLLSVICAVIWFYQWYRLKE